MCNVPFRERASEKGRIKGKNSKQRKKRELYSVQQEKEKKHRVKHAIQFSFRTQTISKPVWPLTKKKRQLHNWRPQRNIMWKAKRSFNNNNNSRAKRQKKNFKWNELHQQISQRAKITHEISTAAYFPHFVWFLQMKKTNNRHFISSFKFFFSTLPFVCCLLFAGAGVGDLRFWL